MPVPKQVVFSTILLAVLALGIFSSAGRDDVYISYWPAHTLATSGEVLNYNGDRVEQSSSLLHVLILGFLHWLTRADLSAIGGVLSFAAAAAGLVAIDRLASRIDPRSAAIATLLTASSVYYEYWSLGGLEATMTAFLLVVLVLSHGRYLASGSGERAPFGTALLVTLGVVMVRPEMPIFLIALLAACLAVAGWLVHRGVAGAALLLSRLARLLGATAALSAAVAGFRLLYFGSVFPLPVSAKIGPSLSSGLEQGLWYLHRELWVDPFGRVVAVAAGIAVAVNLWSELRQSRPNATVLLGMLAVPGYLAFAALSGGDWMEGGRFLVPILPLASLAIPLAVIRITERRPLLIAVSAALLLFQLGWLYSFASTSSRGMPLWEAVHFDRELATTYGGDRYTWFERTNRVHARDIPTVHHLRRVVDRILESRPGQPLNVLSGQMGFVPYILSREHPRALRFTDLAGLVEPSISRCRFLDPQPRRSWGIVVGVVHYLEIASTLRTECGIAEPDVIYDVGRAPRADGYTLVYQQTGDIDHRTRWLQGAVVPGDQFVLVRNDLVPSLAGVTPVELDVRTLGRAKKF